MSGSEIDGVRKWLNTQGFPLEMRTADQFIKAGFNTVQSHYYEVDGEVHEIDLRAQCAWTDDNCVFISVVFVVECKSSINTARPWVIFTSSRGSNGPFTLCARDATTYGRRLLSNLAFRWEEMRKLPILLLPERIGFGLSVSHGDGTDKNDVAFHAVKSVRRAAKAIWTCNDFHHELLDAKIVFPVIVTGQPLYECYLKDSEIVLEKVDTGVLSRQAGGRTELIHIVSESALPKFVSDAYQSATTLLDQYKELTAVASAYYKDRVNPGPKEY